MTRKERQTPWWSLGPCPAWCTAPHDEDDVYDLKDRIHYGDNVSEDDLELSLVEPYELGEGRHKVRGIHALGVYVEQHFREIEPHVCVEMDQGDGVRLTLAEARTLAGWLTAATEQVDGGKAVRVE